jgi:hypothetical protein
MVPTAVVRVALPLLDDVTRFARWLCRRGGDAEELPREEASDGCDRAEGFNVCARRQSAWGALAIVSDRNSTTQAPGTR